MYECQVGITPAIGIPIYLSVVRKYCCILYGLCSPKLHTNITYYFSISHNIQGGIHDNYYNYNVHTVDEMLNAPRTNLTSTKRRTSRTAQPSTAHRTRRTIENTKHPFAHDCHYTFRMGNTRAGVRAESLDYLTSAQFTIMTSKCMTATTTVARNAHSMFANNFAARFPGHPFCHHPSQPPNVVGSRAFGTPHNPVPATARAIKNLHLSARTFITACAFWTYRNDNTRAPCIHVRWKIIENASTRSQARRTRWHCAVGAGHAIQWFRSN